MHIHIYIYFFFWKEACQTEGEIDGQFWLCFEYFRRDVNNVHDKDLKYRLSEGSACKFSKIMRRLPAVKVIWNIVYKVLGNFTDLCASILRNFEVI